MKISYNPKSSLAAITPLTAANDDIIFDLYASKLWAKGTRIGADWADISSKPSSLKNPYALTISLNGASQGPYDGSTAKNINITPGSIGAATSGHNHDGRYVYNYGGTNMDANSLNKNALGMSNNSGITGDWWHILQASWNNEYRWNSLIAFPTLNKNGMYYRSGLLDNTAWGDWVKLLDVNNSYVTGGKGYINSTEITLVNNASLLQTARNLWGNSFNGTADINGTIKFNNVTSGLCEGILWTCGDNDYARIKAGATGSNAGYLEIATADDGNEPIYVRQYTGLFGSVKRTLTLLDASGYTHFPGYINIGGNENNNSSPDRVWGSNGSDSYLRSYRTSALRVAYAVNANSATTASSANKLTTARNIALGTDLRGSANFDGSSNITISANINACTVQVGNTNGLPFKRIAHFETGNSLNDNALLLYISLGYINGSNGICRVEFKTDNISSGSTSVTASAAVRWLVRNGYGLDSLYAGYYVTTSKAYIDIYLKTTGDHQGTVIRVLLDSRGNINSNVLLINSYYHSDSDHKEAYNSIEAASTALYNRAYTRIVLGSDVGTVSYSNSTGSVHWNNVTNKPSTFNPAEHTHTVFRNNLMIKGTNGVSDSASIHLGIGDSDTGFKWISDGKCLIYANNIAVGEWTQNGMNWFKNPTVNGNKVWNAGNDGSGSGLDADTVDGYHASKFPYINNNGIWKVYGNSAAAALADDTAGLSSWAFGESRNSSRTYLGILKPSTATCGISAHGTIAVFGQGDTHLGIASDFGGANLQVFGGNADKIVWRKKIAFADGTGASGTWNISINGNATTATKLQTPRNLWGNSFDGTKDINGSIVFPNIGDTATSNKISWSGSTDGADIYYLTTGQNLGNLVLNVKDDTNEYILLALNGVFKSHFDVANSYWTGRSALADKWTTARTFTIGNTAKNVDGSGNVSWSLAEIGVKDTWRAVQVNGTSIGNNTLNLCGSTYIGLTNVNGKVTFSLVGSGTTANQAILSNGTANGWTLKTLNIANWDTAYNFVSTITGEDADNVINKWEEIVNFLAGITEDNKLNTLLNSKLSILLLAAKEILTTKTNNALYWVDTRGNASTITTGPFTDYPYALLSVTNHNNNSSNFYRSRLAFSSAGDLKVASCHHQGEYKLDDTWYNVLTSKNSGIDGSTIKLNGTSITVYSSGAADGRYVKKSGDTMTGALNFANYAWNNVGDDVAIGDHNVAGCLGIKGITASPGLAFYNSSNTLLSKLVGTTNLFLRISGNNTYNILDNSTTHINNNTITINGTSLTVSKSDHNHDGRYLKWLGNAGQSNMNAIGRISHSSGMTNLSDPGNTIDNPMEGGSKSTSWHLYWQTNHSDDPSGSNAWVALIVNKAGTDRWWVRSRSGGTITNGTNWNSNWRFLVTAPTSGLGSANLPVYINSAGEVVLANNYPTSLKSPYSLTLKANGTILATYDGSSYKEANFTYANVGAASASHTHTYIVAEDHRASYPGLILGPRSMKLSFLSASTLGIKGDSDYYDVITVRSYGDSSGGHDNALIFSKNTKSLYHTSFNFGSTSSWGSPLLIIDSGNIGSQSVAYASKAGNADTVDGYHANGLLTALSNTNNGISITVGGTTKSITNISVNHANSAGSATNVIVNLHTANDSNYPLVWSNLSNTNNATENQLFKSWLDLYYNPKNKRLFVRGSINTANINATGTVTSAGFKHSAVTENADLYVLTAGGGYTFLNLASNELAHEFSKDITVTSEWTDIEDFYGGNLNFLTLPGTYIVLVYYNDNSADGMYEGYFSGIMSWYTGTTNSNNADEIVLHRVGHSYANTIYLRTRESLESETNPYTKLQISANSDLKQHTYKFKFKRIC